MLSGSLDVQVIGGLVGMATLAVEHARRKHAAQLAAVFSELLHTVSLLRYNLTFESPQSAAELQTFVNDVKTKLHTFYMQARFQSPQRLHHKEPNTALQLQTS